MVKESDVEVLDFDANKIDQETLKEYEQLSENLKSNVAKEAGVKVSKGDDYVLMSNNGTDDEGNIDVKLKKEKRGNSFTEVKRSGDFRKHVRQYFQDHGKALIIGIIFFVLILLNTRTLYNFYMALSTLNLSYTFFDNIIYEVVVMVLPIILWFFSTNYPVFNFRNRKLILFNLSYFFFNLAFVRITFIFAYLISTPFITRIPVTGDMTSGKIVAMVYIFTIIPTALVTALLVTIATRSTVLNKEFISKMRDFRLFKVVDNERYSKYEYTYSVVRNMESGSYITIPQKDRQMHTVIIGATGTAKTSSVLLPAIRNDLIVRIRNKKAMKAALWKHTKSGMLRMKEEFEDIDFTPDYFEVNPDFKVSLLHKLLGRTPERILSYILEKYEIAGQTILAPEDSLTDAAYDLFVAHGEKCNRVDPVLVDGKPKLGFKGMNIFYISPSFPEWKLDREMVRRSTLLADVMQIMFEMGGKSDPYFASVNRIATTTVSLLLQLTYPTLKGRAPTLVDVRDGLNDFRTLIEPYEHLFPKGATIIKNNKWRWLNDNLKNYFLGEGATTFEQHARGLKVQFSSFLADDYIKNLVAADDVIDFDEILANNELTVVNIELPEIGTINSPALGLFFTVNMSNAILRRPGTENTRTFHSWRIDEFPIVVTPSMEQAFTLFRKFKVAMEVALQTLDQMEKTPFLKYLAGVITNSTANQIFFGRASLSEMELVSKLSGTMSEPTEMRGRTEDPLFAENPGVKEQIRKTDAIVNAVEESHVRFRDFQEVMYITTKRGTLMPTVHGKVEFLKRKHARGPRKIKRRNWAKLYEQTSKDHVLKVPAKKQSKLALSPEEIDKMVQANDSSQIIYVNENNEDNISEVKENEIIVSNVVEDAEVNTNIVIRNNIEEVEASEVKQQSTGDETQQDSPILEFEDFDIEDFNSSEENKTDAPSSANSQNSETSVNKHIDPIEAQMHSKDNTTAPIDSKEARKRKMDGYDSFVD